MIIMKGTMKTKKKVAKLKEMIIRKGMTKTKKKMIIVEGDKQDWEEDGKVQTIVLLRRKQTPQKKGQITLVWAPNLKSCHILSSEEDD